jgi:DNA-binding MarR family transcriptional regulator
MSPDAIIANPGRLKILTALAVESRQEFVNLRRRTQLTDGNLASHARRLQSAGFIAIDKSIRDGKPVTSLQLTLEGRHALESHVRRLMAAISTRRVETTDAVPVTPIRTAPIPEPVETREDWVD